MNKTKKIIALGACTLLLCGCGKETPTLSDGSQAVISFNEGNESISANQLYEKLKENYALDALITLMDTELLENKYPDKLAEAKKTAESTVKAMKAMENGEEQIIAYYGSVENYQNAVYLGNLRNLAILDYAKTLVKEDNAKAYYDKNIYGDVTVDHILIKTGVTKDTSEEDKKKLETDAKNKINEIIEKLNQAEDKEATFKSLSKEYSEDDTTKNNGGSLGAINTGTLSSSYDELLKAARELKDKSYSTSLITTELGYHVIYRESASEKPSYDDQKENIYKTLAEEKIEADDTIAITALDEFRKSAGMEINDSDIKTKYGNYLANLITQAKNNAKK